MNILLREDAGGAYVQQRYEALGMALGDGRSVREGVSSADERGGVYRARVHCEVVLEGTDDCKTLKQEKDGRSALARRDSKSSCPLSTGADPVHADVRLQGLRTLVCIHGDCDWKTDEMVHTCIRRDTRTADSVGCAREMMQRIRVGVNGRRPVPGGDGGYSEELPEWQKS